jgi:hypothetical protein
MTIKNEIEAGREGWRLPTLYEMLAVERHESVVQVRAVVVLAMLAMLRKLIVLDLATTDAGLLLALSAAMLALGLVYGSCASKISAAPPRHLDSRPLCKRRAFAAW